LNRKLDLQSDLMLNTFAYLAKLFVPYIGRRSSYLVFSIR